MYLRLFIFSIYFIVTNLVAENNNWQLPKMTDKLVRMPVSFIDKSVNDSFKESTLGQSLLQTKQAINEKAQSVSELQNALIHAEGETKIEVNHQLLAEKKQLITLSAKRNHLLKKQYQQKNKFYQILIDKEQQKTNNQNTVLTDQQQKAQKTH